MSVSGVFVSTVFQFVSHPNVQQLLASIWYEGLPGFRRKNMALQALEIVRIGKFSAKTFLSYGVGGRFWEIKLTPKTAKRSAAVWLTVTNVPC